MPSGSRSGQVQVVPLPMDNINQSSTVDMSQGAPPKRVSMDQYESARLNHSGSGKHGGFLGMHNFKSETVLMAAKRLVTLALYIAISSAVMCHLEDWTAIDAAYFGMVTMRCAGNS